MLEKKGTRKNPSESEILVSNYIPTIGDEEENKRDWKQRKNLRNKFKKMNIKKEKKKKIQLLYRIEIIVDYN